MPFHRSPSLALLALLGALFPRPAHAQTVWRAARLDDVHTRVEMPGRFRVETQSQVTPQGYVVERTLAQHATSGGTFAVVVSEQQGGQVSSPQQLAEVLSTPILRQWSDVEVRGHRRLSLPGFYADETSLEADDHLGFVRCAVGRRRTYLVIAIVPSDDLGRARRFVRSLRPDRDDALFEVGPEDAPGRWTLVDVPHEHFAVRMPAPSVDRLARLRLSDGETAPARIVEGRDGAAVYRVRAVDRADIPDASAAAIAERLGLHGERRSVQANGHPGWELEGDRGQRVQLYRGRERWILLEVEPIADAATRADEFFASLVLL